MNWGPSPDQVIYEEASNELFFQYTIFIIVLLCDAV